MNDLVDGVAVTNAALAEVGLPENAFRQMGRVALPFLCLSSEGYRAIILGAAAELGMDAMVRCVDCSPEAELRHTAPCTPARDALRGVRCGAA